MSSDPGGRYEHATQNDDKIHASADIESELKAQPETMQPVPVEITGQSEQGALRNNRDPGQHKHCRLMAADLAA
jgi:hypothetical protein